MKKLLVLTSVILSATAFAANDSADMSITAQVMKPASIETIQDLEFGKIIAGFNHTQTQEGKFKVKFGEENAPNVTYSFEGKTLDVNGFNGTTSVDLLHSNRQDKLPVELAIKKGAISQNGDNKVMDITVGGTAKPATSQAPGQYSGILTARISYN